MPLNNMYTQNPYLASPYYVPQTPMFQPNYFQPMLQAASQSQPQPQPQQNQSQFSSIWFNGGEAEAKNFPVGPNNAVALWSETDPVIYLRSADATGKPSLKIYDLVERNTVAVPADKSVEYITKDDFTGIVNGMTDVIASLKSDLESMKNDMYGIAGKKKTSVRKTDGGEDA